MGRLSYIHSGGKMPGNSRRSRRRAGKKAKAAQLTMLLVFIVLAGFAAGIPLMRHWLPSYEHKDLNEWFEVSGPEVKIYLDGEAEQDYKGTAFGGDVYLPYQYVLSSLNEHFYYNSSEQLLTYTLPDEVLDFTGQMENGEAPAFIISGDEAYVSLALIEKYTDISDLSFAADSDVAKRVFINHGGSTVEQGIIRHKTALRTAADKKAPILTELKKDETVTVSHQSGAWSRIVTESGFAGFVKNSSLSYTEGEHRYVYPDTYTEPEVPYVMLDKKVVLGFQAVHSQAANDNLASLYENTRGAVNVIAPQWLQINSADGGLTDFSSAEYVSQAHGMGLKVWAVLDNINQPGGVNDFSTRDFFADTAKRRSFIASLMQKAESYGYDGINLDFEGLPNDAGQSYTQFFRELSVECHKRGLTLSIDNYVPYSYNDHYNLKEQGIFADYVIIMGYDEHTGSDIGPVASKSYTEYGIKEALEKISAEHIIEAVPLYTRVWRTNSGEVTSEAMGIKQAEQYVSDNGIILSWDQELGSYYGETMIGSGQIQIWLEENNSLEQKVNVIKEYNIGGIAAWRLGLEPFDVWSTLDLNAG